MKSGKRIVLKATEGVIFRSKESEEEIVIEVVNEHLSSVYSYNYKKPKIPEGYEHVKGTWREGFVIQNKADKSEFVWIPVESLTAQHTIDGIHFNEKLGRVNWYDADFSAKGYHEEVDQDFIESVKKYGGFYFARYHASKEKGKLVFKKGKKPWVNIKYHQAEKEARSYAEDSIDVKSCITKRMSFDPVLFWIIESKAKTRDEVIKDSSSWGNYNTMKVYPTGSRKEWCVLNIYDLAGNVLEWTSEMYGESNYVVRGGCNVNTGKYFPVADQRYAPSDCAGGGISFRAILYLK